MAYMICCPYHSKNTETSFMWLLRPTEYRGDLQWQNTWQAGQERHEAAEEMPKLHVESEYFHI